jgi:hypothetical protein
MISLPRATQPARSVISWPLRTLLSPVEGDEGFGGRYDQALQRDADVMFYHGMVSGWPAAARRK